MSDTLGARIFDAAADYDIYGESGYGAGDRLRALCARADAAERGMVAIVAQMAAFREWSIACGDETASWEEKDDLRVRMNLTDREYEAALAAWRALGEVRS